MKAFAGHSCKRKATIPRPLLFGAFLAALLCLACAAPGRALAEMPTVDPTTGWLKAYLNFQEYTVGHEDTSYDVKFELDSSSSSTYSYKATIKAGDTIEFNHAGGTGSIYADGGLSLIPDGDGDYDTSSTDSTSTQTVDPGDYEYYIKTDAGYVMQQPPSTNKGWRADYYEYKVKSSDKQVTVYARSKAESLTVVFEVGEGSSSPLSFLTEDSNANKNALGWEAVIAIPAAIAVAIAAAVAATRFARRKKPKSESPEKPQEENEEEDTSCTYELRMAKYFGDTLYVGDEAARVYARVVKNTKRQSGVYDEDLTRIITIKSGSPNVKVVPEEGIQQGYKVAAVSAVDMGQDPALVEDGIVELSVMTPVAGYTNRVHFKVEKREVRVVFLDKDYFMALAGDGTTRETRFEIENVITQPDSITLDVPKDLEASCDLIERFRYKLSVTNNVPEFEKPFYKDERREVVLHIWYGKEETIVRVPVYLYPDGLSIDSRHIRRNLMAESGVVLEITSYKVEKNGKKEIPPTEIELKYYYNDVGDDGKITTRCQDMSDAEVEIVRYDSEEPYTKTMLKHYSCKLDKRMADVSMFFITPEYTVPNYYHVVNGHSECPDVWYTGTMTLKASFDVAHKQSGMSWNRMTRFDDTISVPIFVAGQPFDPLMSWRKEHQNLLHAIDVFIDDPNQKESARAFVEEHAVNMTPTELYIRRNALFVSARNRWTAEGAEWMAESRYYDYVIDTLDSVKLAGDVAFSYLVTIYAGPFAEAVLSPAKNIFVALIGEVGASFLRNEAINWDNLGLKDEFNGMGDNMIMTMYSHQSPAKMALAGKVLAYTYMFNVVYHYSTDVDANGQRSLYRAFGTAFKNVSIAATKIIVGGCFQKFMNNPTIKAKILDKVGGWVEKHLSKSVLKLMEDQVRFVSSNDFGVARFKKVDIAQKALEEMCGKGAGQIFDWAFASKNPPADGQVDVRVEVPDPDGQRVEAYIARIDMGKVVFSENPASKAMFDDLYGWWYEEPATTSYELPPAPVVADGLAEGKGA